MIKSIILLILLIILTGCDEKHTGCPTQKCVNGVQVFDTCRRHHILVDQNNNALLCKQGFK